MKRVLAASVALILVSAPLAAQQNGDPADIENGLDQLSDGARTLMRGLMGRVEPEMRDMADALEEWDFNGIGLDDLGQYHPPEKLPNGDIIIRRKGPLDGADDNPMDDEIEI